MMLEVVKHKPENQAKFMVKYMSDKFGDRATIGGRQQLEFLNEEVKRLEQILEEQKKKKPQVEETKSQGDIGSENETDEDEDDDYIDDLPQKLKNKAKGPRSSVSAEAFGVWNKKEDFKPKVIAKSEEARQKILARLD